MRIFILTSILFLLITTSTAEASTYEEPITGICVSLESYISNPAVKQISPIETYIIEYSTLYGVDADLIRAIVDGESEGDTEAYNLNNNGTHDRGLMQINSCNYEWLGGELGITDFYNPKQNIQCGCYILGLLSNKYDSVHQILMSYNMGEGGMRKLWNQGIYSSHYSREVVERYEKLRR